MTPPGHNSPSMASAPDVNAPHAGVAATCAESPKPMLPRLLGGTSNSSSSPTKSPHRQPDLRALLDRLPKASDDDAAFSDTFAAAAAAADTTSSCCAEGAAVAAAPDRSSTTVRAVPSAASPWPTSVGRAAHPQLHFPMPQQHQPQPSWLEANIGHGGSRQPHHPTTSAADTRHQHQQYQAALCQNTAYMPSASSVVGNAADLAHTHHPFPSATGGQLQPHQQQQQRHRYFPTGGGYNHQHHRAAPMMQSRGDIVQHVTASHHRQGWSAASGHYYTTTATAAAEPVPSAGCFAQPYGSLRPLHHLGNGNTHGHHARVPAAGSMPYSYPAAIAEYARAMATERRSAALNGVHAPCAPDLDDFDTFVRASELPDVVAHLSLADRVTSASPAMASAGFAQWRPAARAAAGVAVQTLVVGQMPYFVDAASVGRLLAELAAVDPDVHDRGGAPFAASAIVAVRAHERAKPPQHSGHPQQMQQQPGTRRCGLWFVEVAADGDHAIVLSALLNLHRRALVSDSYVTVASGKSTLWNWATGRDQFLQRLMAEVPDVRRDAHSRFQKGLGPVTIEVCSVPMRRAGEWA